MIKREDFIKLRDKKGYTQKEVAKMLGYSLNKIQRMEQGSRPIRAGDYLALKSIPANAFMKTQQFLSRVESRKELRKRIA